MSMLVNAGIDFTEEYNKHQAIMIKKAFEELLIMRNSNLPSSGDVILFSTARITPCVV